MRDDDERLPIHWAVSYNHMPVVEMLVSRKDFDPDVQVRSAIENALFADHSLLTCWAGFFGLDAVDDCCESAGWRRSGRYAAKQGSGCKQEE